MKKKPLTEFAVSENIYRNLVDHSFVGVLSSRTNGEILYINDAIVRLLDFNTRDEVMSQGSIIRYKYPEQREKMLNILRQEGFINGFEAVILTKNGDEKIFLFNLSLEGDVINGVLVDITLLKQTQKELIKNARRFEALIEKAPDGIVLLNSEANFSYVSPTARRIFGYTAGEEISANPAELTHPEDLPMVLGELARLMEDPSSVPVLQYRFAHRMGHWIWVESTFTNLLADESVQSIVINFRDISKRKKYEDDLRISEDRYRLIFENSGEAILSTEPSGAISSVNQEAERLFGRTAEEIKEVGRAGIMDQNDPRLRAALEIRRQTGLFKGELNLVRGDGSIIPGEVTSKIFKDSSGFERTSMIIRDISERKLIEEKIRSKSEELERINAEKDKLFSIIAHDLRSPFNSLLGFTELLAGGVEDYTLAEIQNIASRMNSTANNLFKLLENLLEWSSIKGGITVFAPALVNLSEMVAQNQSIFSMQMENKQVRVVNLIPEGLQVFVDPQMFNVIIRNLLSNSIKFSNPGGSVTLEARPTSSGYLEFSIRDEGIGMSEEMKAKIFNIGARISRKGTAGEPSSGLGLLLCREYVDKHNGTIRVESEEGKGSAFILKLPLR